MPQGGGASRASAVPATGGGASPAPASPPTAVVVTRPEREAGPWAAGLRQAGLDPRLLPLIAIGPAPDPQALARSGLALPGAAAAMFVSANAARAFLEARPGPWPEGTRAWATGPGTRSALLAGGVPAAAIDTPPEDPGQFDSEALWAQVAPQARPGGRALIVRGADATGQVAGRDWLATRLEEAGMQVDQVAAYARGLPAWDAAAAASAARAIDDRAWWLFSSSEAVANLMQLVPGLHWPAARALCTHPRIAQAADEAGFGHVARCQPVLEAVAAFLQSHP